MRYRIGSRAFAALLLGLLLTMAVPAGARLCSQNSECTGGAVCTTRFNFIVWQWKECKIAACNFDSECTGGTLCLNGGCQPGCRSDADCSGSSSCVNSQCRAPSPQPGAGTATGAGRHCMPADGSKANDWATDAHGKPLGACPQGTTCSNAGFCIELQR